MSEPSEQPGGPWRRAYPPRGERGNVAFALYPDEAYRLLTTTAVLRLTQRDFIRACVMNAVAEIEAGRVPAYIDDGFSNAGEQ